MTQACSKKRKDILQAALELFANHGFHDAPMTQLATQANVAVGSIYRYFKDKDDLIHELYIEVDDDLQNALVREFDTTLPTRQQFVHLVISLINYLKDHPHEFKFLEQYCNSPFGIEKKREKLLLAGDSGSRSAFGDFFSGPTNDDIKPLSIQTLHALAFGPVIFLLREATSGLMKLDDSTITALAEGCWDAIKR